MTEPEQWPEQDYRGCISGMHRNPELQKPLDAPGDDDPDDD